MICYDTEIPQGLGKENTRTCKQTTSRKNLYIYIKRLYFQYIQKPVLGCKMWRLYKHTMGMPTAVYQPIVSNIKMPV